MSLELKPSYQLQLLMEDAAKTLTTFGDKWSMIKQVGTNEGFTEKQLQEMLRPLLKPQLSKDQIYYLFNNEERKQDSRNSRYVAKVNHKNVIEQDKNDHGNELKEDEYIPRPAAYTKEAELVLETGEKQEAVDVKAENIAQKGTIKQLREVIAKMAITTGDNVETNFDRVFEMLPNDDVDTFKNKSGTLMLAERVLINFRAQDPQKRGKYQWFIRRLQ